MAKSFKLSNGLLLLSTEAAGGVYNAAQLKAIAGLCDGDAALVKATEDHRLALFVAPERVSAVAQTLKATGLGVRHYQDGLHQPVNCLGEMCGEHQQDAMGTSMDLARELAQTTLATPLKIGINGCSRCCVPTHTLDISLIGDANGYRISLGGKNSQIPEMASFMAEGVPAAKLPKLVAKVITVYRDLAQPDESLQEVMERCGSKRFVEALAPYSQDAHQSEPALSVGDFSAQSSGDEPDLGLAAASGTDLGPDLGLDDESGMSAAAEDEIQDLSMFGMEADSTAPEDSGSEEVLMGDDQLMEEPALPAKNTKLSPILMTAELDSPVHQELYGTDMQAEHESDDHLPEMMDIADEDIGLMPVEADESLLLGDAELEASQTSHLLGSDGLLSEDLVADLGEETADLEADAELGDLTIEGDDLETSGLGPDAAGSAPAYDLDPDLMEESLRVAPQAAVATAPVVAPVLVAPAPAKKLELVTPSLDEELTADEVGEDEADLFEQKINDSIAEEEGFPESEDLNSASRLEAMKLVELSATTAPAEHDFDDLEIDSQEPDCLEPELLDVDIGEEELEETSVAAPTRPMAVAPEVPAVPGVRGGMELTSVDVNGAGGLSLQFASGACIALDKRAFSGSGRRELRLGGQMIVIAPAPGGVNVEVDGVAIFLPQIAA